MDCQIFQPTSVARDADAHLSACGAKGTESSCSSKLRVLRSPLEEHDTGGPRNCLEYGVFAIRTSKDNHVKGQEATEIPARPSFCGKERLT